MYLCLFLLLYITADVVVNHEWMFYFKLESLLFGSAPRCRCVLCSYIKIKVERVADWQALARNKPWNCPRVRPILFHECKGQAGRGSQQAIYYSDFRLGAPDLENKMRMADIKRRKARQKDHCCRGTKQMG